MNDASLEGAVCGVHEGCITCGDVAVELTVVSVEGFDARCRDDDGREEMVAIGLVEPVATGERLLVHAGVAIERVRLAGPVPGDDRLEKGG